jgi:hypothetical protein
LLIVFADGNDGADAEIEHQALDDGERAGCGRRPQLAEGARPGQLEIGIAEPGDAAPRHGGNELAAILSGRSDAGQTYSAAEELEIRHVKEKRAAHIVAETDGIETGRRMTGAVMELRDSVVETDHAAVKARRRKNSRTDIAAADRACRRRALDSPGLSD